jgi:hypothetical protein
LFDPGRIQAWICDNVKFINRIWAANRNVRKKEYSQDLGPARRLGKSANYTCFWTRQECKRRQCRPLSRGAFLMQRKVTDPLKQLREFRENAKDITGHDIDDRHNRDKGDERKEKTMVEKDRPQPALQMKGPIGARVNRQAHYKNLRDERAREDAKNAGKNKEQTPKFDKEEKDQLRPIFNKEAEHEHTR